MRKLILWIVLLVLGMGMAIGTAILFQGRPAAEVSHAPAIRETIPTGTASIPLPRPTVTPPAQAALPAAPFPKINDKARKLDIPIIMYHDV